MRHATLFDVLLHPPKHITIEQIEHKKNDVQNSAKFSLFFGASTGLAVCLEASMICVASLSALTALLILCLHNESKRLARMKTIPLRDDNNSHNSSLSGSSTKTPTLQYIVASALTQTNNDENNSPNSMSSGSPIRTSTRRAVASAPPVVRHY